jgi:pimeloyl-ACP methyl ester carboxylesterase
LRAESIVVNGTKISYRHNLSGEREVALLLHGLGGDHRGLLQVAQGLSDVDVVIPDVPGYGDSDPLTVPHTLANYAAAVEALRIALDLGPVHLIGHSLGASIALLHAATHSPTPPSRTATSAAAQSAHLPAPLAPPSAAAPSATAPSAAVPSAAAHSVSHIPAVQSAAPLPAPHSTAVHPVATDSTAAAPAALRSLTLLNPVSTANNLTANLGKLYYRVAAALPARAARFWLASKPAVYIADAMVIVSKDKAVRRRILDEDYQNYARASVPAMIESFLSYYDTDFEQHAAHVGVHTLLLTGDADSIAPVASVAALAAAIPSATLRVLPGGGHLLPLETPADVVEPLAAFLRARPVPAPTESV